MCNDTNDEEILNTNIADANTIYLEPTNIDDADLRLNEGISNDNEHFDRMIYIYIYNIFI